MAVGAGVDMDVLKKLHLWRGLSRLLKTRFGAVSSQVLRGPINRMSAMGVSRRNQDDVPWALFTKPLADSSLCVVNTGGLYLEGDEPFDVDSGSGDASFRVMPSDFEGAQVRIAHAHYSHARVKEDLNVLLPIDHLRTLVADGVLGQLAPNFYSFGFGAGLTKEYVVEPDGTAHVLARRLKSEEVDYMLLVPA